MLDEAQLRHVKTQLLQQIETSKLSSKDKEIAKKQIQVMNTEQIEQFLKQNQMLQKQAIQERKIECIFCAILKGQTESIKIDSDKDNLAVLEINPVSMGHILIIPKKHLTGVSDIPSTTFSFAKKISRKLKNKMKAKNVELLTSCKLGHCIINLIPIYGKDVMDFPRQKTTNQQLKEIAKKLAKKTSDKEVIRTKTKKSEDIHKMPRRVP